MRSVNAGSDLLAAEGMIASEVVYYNVSSSISPKKSIKAIVSSGNVAENQAIMALSLN